MPAELKGSVYATRKGYGIRWLENGRRRYRGRVRRRSGTHDVGSRTRFARGCAGGRRESSSSTLAEFVETWLRAHAADVEPGNGHDAALPAGARARDVR